MKPRLAKLILYGLAIGILLVMAVVIVRGQQAEKKVAAPIVLTAEEGKLVDLLRSNWQEKAAEADRKRMEYERAIIAREQASAEAGAELNRLLQSKGGKFEDYDFSWQTKSFTPKKER